MKLVSVNVGLPREVMWHGINVTTGIFKEPVAGRVALRKLNLDGDRQADLNVHGGAYKAVYCYPLAHYDYWRKELAGREVPIAMFGENFTVDFSTRALTRRALTRRGRFFRKTQSIWATGSPSARRR